MKIKSNISSDIDLLGRVAPTVGHGAEVERAVVFRTVRGVRVGMVMGVRGEEGGDVLDGSQERGAGLWTVVVGQRDEDFILVPDVEGVVGERHSGRRVSGGDALQIVVLVFVFIIGRTQHTVCIEERDHKE